MVDLSLLGKFLLYHLAIALLLRLWNLWIFIYIQFQDTEARDGWIFWGWGVHFRLHGLKAFLIKVRSVLPDPNSIDLTSVPGLFWAYVAHFR